MILRARQRDTGVFVKKDDLALARRHIANAEDRIARMRELAARLVADGHQQLALEAQNLI